MNSKKDKTLEKLPSFDWDKAKNFYYIAKLGNMTEAARQLNITQSSLSRQLILLEDSLKCKLFIRTGRGVKMTRKGEELFEVIERAFIDLKRFSYNHAAMAGKGQKRKIRISTTHAVATYILNNLFSAYNENHPDIIFELIGEDHFIDLIINDVDIAIRPYDTNSHNIHQEHLFTLERKLYASQKYIKTYGEPKTIEDLKDHHIIAHARPEEHPYSDVQWILRLGLPVGKFHQPIFVSNSIECLIEEARKGRGIIGSYEEYKIIKESNLKNILPQIKDKPVKWFFNYPKHLEKDETILNIKNYLSEKLAPQRR